MHALLLASVVLVGGPLAATAEAAPTMTSMSPKAGPMSGGTIATITGTELDQITRVWFGVTPGKVVSATPTTLTVRSPSSDDDGGVTVTAGTATGGADGGFNYRYFKMVDFMAPNQGSELGGTEVQVHGEGLDRVTRVVFFCDADERYATILRQTSSSLFARTPRCRPGGTTVHIEAPDFGWGAVPYRFLDVVTPPAITSLSPDRGPTAGGTTVTVQGTFLADVSTVRFGDVAATIGAKSDTTLTFVTPPGTAGSVEVTFTNGEGATKRTFTYDAPVPDPPAPDDPDPPAPDDPDPPAPDAPGPVVPGPPAPEPIVPAPLLGPAPLLPPTPLLAPTPAPGPAASSRTPRCALAVKGKTLGAATAAIRRSGCRVGKVKRPTRVRKGTRLVVAAASLARGSTTRVDLTLRARRR